MAVLTEEQSMLRDCGASTWVQDKSPVTAFRKVRDSQSAELGYDPAAFERNGRDGLDRRHHSRKPSAARNFGYLRPGPDPGRDSAAP